MGCTMTKCKLLQCIRSRKPEGTITTTITGGPHSKSDRGRYFYFSSVYVARVRSGAADQKSSRGPGAALQGIHDIVQLQGCAETVRAAKVAMSTFPCDNYSPGSAEYGQRKAKHRMALQRQRRRIMRVRWQGFGRVV